MTGSHDRESMMNALTQAMPYIRLYRGHVFVIKLGGALGSDTAALRELAAQAGVLCEFGVRVVLVHGGGPQTTDLAGRLGLETTMIDGRRVTSPATLEAAVMAMNGSVSTAILAACRAAGLAAIGLSGVAAGLIRARVRPPVTVEGSDGTEIIDYGEVGDIVSIDRGVLDRLLGAGFVPVISPIAADDRGRVLNINADTVAAEVARALAADKLIFLTETPGLLEDRRDPGSLVSYIDLGGLKALENRGALAGGMLPKIVAARAALTGGVGRVHVIGFRQRRGLLIEVLTNEGSGTLIVRETAELMPAEHGAPRAAAASTTVGAP
jgi:acetylglutamate kinase